MKSVSQNTKQHYGTVAILLCIKICENDLFIRPTLTKFYMCEKCFSEYQPSLPNGCKVTLYKFCENYIHQTISDIEIMSVKNVSQNTNQIYQTVVKLLGIKICENVLFI